MTVKQLKEALEKYPDNMDVFLAERKTEYSFGLLNSVGSQEILFIDEGMPIDDFPEIECVVLDED